MPLSLETISQAVDVLAKIDGMQIGIAEKATLRSHVYAAVPELRRPVKPSARAAWGARAQSILDTLERAGGRATMTQIANTIGVPVRGFAEIVRRLERQGLVRTEYTSNTRMGPGERRRPDVKEVILMCEEANANEADNCA